MQRSSSFSSVVEMFQPNAICKLRQRSHFSLRPRGVCTFFYLTFWQLFPPTSIPNSRSPASLAPAALIGYNQRPISTRPTLLRICSRGKSPCLNLQYKQMVTSPRTIVCDEDVAHHRTNLACSSDNDSEGCAREAQSAYKFSFLFALFQLFLPTNLLY